LFEKTLNFKDVPQKDISIENRFADSMPSRIEKVIAAKGGHIDD
jgi:hypothetical protein